MKRRNALQAIVFFSIASNTFISCKSRSEVIEKLGLKNLSLDDDQVNLIDVLSKTIFPVEKVEMFKGHTALAHVLSMVDRLYTKEERQKFLSGMKSFNTDFLKMDDAKKLVLLKSINESNATDDKQFFFNTVKDQTIKYFSTTEEFMRGVTKYEMVPGRWKACIKIDQIETKKQ